MSKNRNTLKGYFKKSTYPSESHFADLIDGMLIQEEDGISKTAGDPLSIKAVGDAKQTQTLLNFCESGQDSPAWKLQLIPVSGQTAPGFSISDGQDNSRLFIDNAGNIGMGTKSPQAKLDIAGVLKIGENKERSISFYRGEKDVNTAGKIIYKGTLGADALNIVGAGPSDGNRKIKLLDHVQVHGKLVAESIDFTKGTASAANAGSISSSYKGDPKGNALSINGCGPVNKQKINCVGNVEVSGGLTIRGDVVSKVAFANGSGFIEYGKPEIDKPQQVAWRVLKFNKQYIDTAIRILYSDNLCVYDERGQWRPFVRVFIKIVSVPSLHVPFNDQNSNEDTTEPSQIDGEADTDYIKDAQHLFADWSMCPSCHDPVTLFGHVNKKSNPGDYEIQVWFVILKDYTPNKVNFGLGGAEWSIEAQEVWI